MRTFENGPFTHLVPSSRATTDRRMDVECKCRICTRAFVREMTILSAERACDTLAAWLALDADVLAPLTVPGEVAETGGAAPKSKKRLRSLWQKVKRLGRQ